MLQIAILLVSIVVDMKINKKNKKKSYLCDKMITKLLIIYVTD